MADRVKVGSAEVAMVWDSEFRYTPSQFLASMPAEKWAPYLNGVSPDEIQESRVMTFLIRSQGKIILVDAGVGAHGEDGAGLVDREALDVRRRILPGPRRFVDVHR